MAITTSKLRANIYRVLDHVLNTGQSVEIQRRGRVLKIIVADDAGRLARLEPHPDYLSGDPEDVVHLDWSENG